MDIGRITSPLKTAQDRLTRASFPHGFPTLMAVGGVGSGIRTLKIRVEQDGSLVLGAREEMAVEVERDGDRGVAHEGLKRLGVDAGGDHQARERVAALVQRDRPQVGLLPRALRAIGHG